MIRIILVLSVLLTLLTPLVSGCSPASKPENTATTQASHESKKLTVVSPAFIAMMKDPTKQSSHDSTIDFAQSGNGVVYIEPVGKQFRVVHNGRPGRAYNIIGDLVISRDGTRAAYVARNDETFKRVVVDGWEGPLFMSVESPQFSPDGRHLVYTITQDNSNFLVIDNKVHHEIRIDPDILISPDSRSIAFASTSNDGVKKQFVIADFSLQGKKVFESCGESFLASDDRSHVAVACVEKNAPVIKIIDLQNRSLVSTLPVPADRKVVRKRFSPDNRTFIFTTMTGDFQRFLHYNGWEEKTPAGDEFMSDPLLFKNPERVGVITGMATKVSLYTAFSTSKDKEAFYGFITDFIASRDGRHHAYVAIKAGGEERMSIVVDGHEGPLFDKIVSPAFSPDGRLLVYRARQGGKRFLVVSDLKGKIIRQHKDYGLVFPPVFVDNGASVAYGVLDGSELWWKVEKL